MRGSIMTQVKSRNDDPKNLKSPFHSLQCFGWNYNAEREELLARQYGQITGQFSPSHTDFFHNTHNRQIVIEAIVSRYFSEHTDFFLGSDYQRVDVHEAPSEYPPKINKRKRDHAFAKEIRRIYDHQCVACGMRLVIPAIKTHFIDAAHLIPVEVSENDNPTNGIALCKNCHWAMDRFIITPTTKNVWRVSKILLDSPEQYHGAKHLLQLEGNRMKQPNDTKYAPLPRNLAWREERLLT